MNPSDCEDGAVGIAGTLSLAVALESPALLDAVPDAILVVNQEGTILQINSQAESMFGYMRDELIGQRIEMLLPEQHRKQHCPIATISRNDPERAAWDPDWIFEQDVKISPSFLSRSVSVRYRRRMELWS